MEAIASVIPVGSVSAACLAVGVPRATFYRWRHAQEGSPLRATLGGSGGVATPPLPPAETTPTLAEPCHPRALSATERQTIRDVLHSERFRDSAPAEVYATLLDEGTYLASERTMYRLLVAAGETGERRNQRVHPPYTKPELLATAPNEVWSWDIERHEALSTVR